MSVLSSGVFVFVSGHRKKLGTTPQHSLSNKSETGKTDRARERKTESADVHGACGHDGTQ